MQNRMEYRYLGQTDIKVSKIGFGGTPFGNFYEDFKFDIDEIDVDRRVKRLVDKAFEYGINYFDTSPWYGISELLLGRALSSHPRDSYYIATKVGRYNSDKPQTEWFNFSYEKTIKSVENSLKLLKCDYIDLIQVHDFEFADDFNQIINETLPALEYLKSVGKVRYIGINSYSIEHLKRCLEMSTVKIDTVLTFCHLCLDDASLLEHVDYFKSKNVGIINASPFSMGLFTERGPPKWHKAPQFIKDTALYAFEFCKQNNCNLKKLAFNFSVNQPDIDLTISGFGDETVLDEDMKYLKEGLNDNDKAVLNFIRQHIFGPLDYTGHGDREIKHYRMKINELKQYKA